MLIEMVIYSDGVEGKYSRVKQRILIDTLHVGAIQIVPKSAGSVSDGALITMGGKHIHVTKEQAECVWASKLQEAEGEIVVGPSDDRYR